MNGKKFDTDKLRWDLLPVREVEDVVRVLTHGAKKYAPYNWQRVENLEDRYYAAMLRHLSAWRQGEVLDRDTRLPHLAHAVCNAFFLMWADRKARRGRYVPQA